MSRNLILASGSPRRIEMLEKHGYTPQVIKPQVTEDLPQGISMAQAVLYLALKKALYVERLCEEGVILAADTVVYLDRIIGKPKSFEEAKATLTNLCGRRHLVATGVAILDAHTQNRSIFYQVTEVFLKRYEEQDILDYIKTGEPWDKAGGYGIQGAFAKHIDHYVGDYDNVCGFPFKEIQKKLREMGLE